MRRASPYPMLETDLAVRMVLERAEPLPPVRIQLANVPLRSVLAEDVVAPRPVPPYPCSVVDGYAVVAPVDLRGRGEFDGLRLEVIKKIRARREIAGSKERPLSQGECAYITTGARLPDGANAVIMIEDTLEAAGGPPGATYVRIMKSAEPGQAVRHIGSDMKASEMVLQRGSSLGPAEIGLLATCGVHSVLIHPQPTVGVMSTGDELIDVTAPDRDEEADFGIRDSNRPSLISFVRGEGAIALDLGIVSDSKEALEGVLRDAIDKCDIILTTGGVSMGEADFVKPLLERMGEVHFGRIRMKPGKPTTFATVTRVDNAAAHNGAGSASRKVIVLGLPGNPVSSLVCASLFASPAIKRMKGLAAPCCHPRQVQAHVSSAIRPDPVRDEFHRAQVVWDGDTSRFIATSTGSQASSRLLSMRSANSLLYIKSGGELIPEGSKLDCLLIGDVPPPSSGRGLFDSTMDGGSSAAAHDQGSRVRGMMDAYAAVITVSDRASKGIYKDESGPAIREWFQSTFPKSRCKEPIVVPDEVDRIQGAILQEVREIAPSVDVIITTGGTGFSPRDVTPEAIEPLLKRRAPGLVHVLLEAGLKHTPLAVLSRPVAGVIGSSLIVTLPGSVKAVRENLRALEPLLPRIVNLLRGDAC